MKSNFNSVNLLCGSKIFIIGKRNETYEMILPVLRDKNENLDYDIFISFCATPLEEINQKNKSNFISKLSLLKTYRQYNKDISKILEKYLAKFMVGFKYVDDSLYWGDRLVGKEVFELFCDYCAIAGGVKSIKDLELIITEDMDEFDKMQIEYEKKIRKAKEKDENGSKSADLDLVLTGVVQTFGYTYEQLQDKTLYSIYFMYSQLNRIANYEIGNIAAGNGLLSKGTKHSHWAM